MSSATGARTDDDADSESEGPSELETLRGRVEVLREENRRLRAEYLRARQAQYRRAAVGLFAVGLVALAGAALLPASRTTLLVLAGTGGFGGSLLYFLTPDQLVPVSVGRSVYDAYERHASHLADELGLQDAAVYVPRARGRETAAPERVRLFVPQAREWDLPPDDVLASTFVAPDDGSGRGVSFEPTGASLLDEFGEAAEPSGSDPADLAASLCEAVVEQFELAASADAEVDTATNRVSVRVRRPAYGDPTAFDHPVVSVVGAGLAAGLRAPVETATVESVDAETYLVSYRYRSAAASADEAD